MAGTRKLGGSVATLAIRDSFSTTASLGNPRGAKGGYLKSPLMGSMVASQQLNNLNLPKNNMIDPLGLEPDAQDLLVVSLPTASIIALTVAEIVSTDPVAAGTGGGTVAPSPGGEGSGGGGAAPGDGPGPGPGAPGDGDGGSF